MSKKIVVSGYFGFDNLGDEAILYSIVNAFSEFNDVEIVALSKNPKKTSEKFKIKAVDRMSLGAVLNEIKKCDVFVSGGGSLLQDVTSRRSPYYYLGLIYIAKKLFKKKVIIYSQGIGPINDSKNRKNIAKIFNALDIINVRDKDSKNLLREIGVKKEIIETADTVFTLIDIDEEFGRAKLANLDNGITAGISVRKWKDCDDKTIEEVAKFIKKNEERDINFILLPFHHPDDLEISQAIFEKADSKKLTLLKDKFDEKEMLSLIKNTDIMISMRLHGVIFATVCNSYPIAISYDPKIDSISNEIGIDEIININSISSEILQSFFDNALLNLEAKKRKLSVVKEEMYKKAMQGVMLIKELL